MNQTAHNKLVSFIWSIADDCLRDVYVRGKYRDVILTHGCSKKAWRAFKFSRSFYLRTRKSKAWRKNRARSKRGGARTAKFKFKRRSRRWWEKDPLDEIIRNFNEKLFKGWDATPDKQRAKFIHIMGKVKAHKDF